MMHGTSNDESWYHASRYGTRLCRPGHIWSLTDQMTHTDQAAKHCDVISILNKYL